jgi:hypothetical protein
MERAGMKYFLAENLGTSVRKSIYEVAGHGKPLDHQGNVEKVILPEQSYGVCQVWYRNTKYGRSHNAEESLLANGLCVDCWDKGLGGQNTYHQVGQARANRKKYATRRVLNEVS